MSTQLSVNNDQMPPGMRGMFGFNLDNRFSASMRAGQMPADCAHGDFFSALDSDQNMGTCTEGMAGGGSACRGGVDNQLPAILGAVANFMPGFDGNMLLNEQIRSGTLSLIIRVSDVNGALGPTLNDPNVTVRVYPFASPAFPNCSSIGTPGQNYVIDPRSLTSPTDLNSARLSYQGSIVNGRLRITPMASNMPNFSLNIPIQGTNIELALFNTQLRVNMTGADTGTGGNLGGFVKQTLLVQTLTSIPALMQFRDAAVGLIAGFVDVATPVGAGNSSCDTPEGGIGIGLGFTVTRANVAAAPGMPPTGSCGASSGSDAGTRRD